MTDKLRERLSALVIFVIVVGLPLLVKDLTLTLTETISAAVGCLALAFRRRWPLQVLGVVLVATLVSMYSAELVFPMALMTLMALYQVGRSSSIRIVALCTCICVGAVYVTTDLAKDIEHFDLSSANQLGWFIAAAAAGVVVENQHQFRAEAGERARREKETREADARRRISEERLRIAQELHDALGHNMAVINVQAGVAAHVFDARPDQARQAMELIRSASSAAMEEIRTTLGLLRTVEPPDGQPVAPALGMDDVPMLVDRARAGGLRTSYTLRGQDAQVQEVPLVISTTVYRLIQEALTNCLKHAGPGTRVDVMVDFGDSGLRVTVEDDGAGEGAQGGGSGLGLRGMRERVAAIGGTLEAGERRPRGFRVVTKIPMEAR
ncbi:sensor histidine kinase [Streptomyces sp. NPDC058989]|uniref:sensor histidine kinase n=1 Tax=Streptomyces sp. NPDC058989 TaxID=3346686 RepID=UPI0036BA9DF5